MSQVNRSVLSNLTPCQGLWGYELCNLHVLAYEGPRYFLKKMKICVDTQYLSTFAHMDSKYECVVCSALCPTCSLRIMEGGIEK